MANELKDPLSGTLLPDISLADPASGSLLGHDAFPDVRIGDQGRVNEFLAHQRPSAKQLDSIMPRGKEVASRLGDIGKEEGLDKEQTDSLIRFAMHENQLRAYGTNPSNYFGLMQAGQDWVDTAQKQHKDLDVTLHDPESHARVVARSLKEHPTWDAADVYRPHNIGVRGAKETAAFLAGGEAPGERTLGNIASQPVVRRATGAKQSAGRSKALAAAIKHFKKKGMTNQQALLAMTQHYDANQRSEFKAHRVPDYKSDGTAKHILPADEYDAVFQEGARKRFPVPNPLPSDDGSLIDAAKTQSTSIQKALQQQQKLDPKRKTMNIGGRKITLGQNPQASIDPAISGAFNKFIQAKDVYQKSKLASSAGAAVAGIQSKPNSYGA